MRKHAIRLTVLTLALVLLLALLPGTALAADGDWTYEELSDGTLCITGYTGSATKLTIPGMINGKIVTKIGENLFKNNSSLKEVLLPEDLTTLGYSAFAGCTALTRVYIPSTIQEANTYYNYSDTAPFAGCTALDTIEFGEGIRLIPDNLFRNCTGLTHIEIPDTVARIGSSAFKECVKLASVRIPHSVLTIGDGAFANCTALTKVELPEDLTTLGYSAFAGCTALAKVYIPSTIQEAYTYYNYSDSAPFSGCTALDTVEFGEGIPLIPDNLFMGCTGLTHIEIPDTVTRIGSTAFKECVKLASVRIPHSVLTIGDGAFADCTALTELELPEDLTTLGYSAFAGCTALAKVYIPSTIQEAYTYYNYSDSAPFSGCTALDTIEFGEGIPFIPDNLFMGCTGLTHIEIPDTVTRIGSTAFKECVKLASVEIPDTVAAIGVGAFANCTALTEIELLEGFRTLEYSAFAGCTALAKVYIPSTIREAYTYYNYSDSAPFSGCTALDTIEFGEGIPLIPDNLFMGCTGLTHIEIPDTAESIGSKAFLGCINLTSVEISASVRTIGDGAFNKSGLKLITIPDTVTTYNGAFLQECTSLKTAKLSDSALKLPEGMFSGCTALESAAIPKGVTEVPKNTFNGCTALTATVIPNTVTSIGNNAFYGCAALTDLSFLPGTVASIGSSAFENCTGLTSATLPAELETLGSSVFKGCKSLASFKADANLKSFGDNCFENCVALKNVSLSNKLKIIPAYAFAGCRALERLDIPDGVTTIKNNAFYQDTKLLVFIIPASVTSIGSDAFSYPTKTTVYGVTGSYAETYANWMEFIPLSDAPGDIANVVVTPAAGGKITLSWGASYNAKTYILQRHERGSSVWTTLSGSITGTTYTDKSGTPGKIYQYRVRGRDGGSYGAFKTSAEVACMTDSVPGSTGTPKVEASAGGKITVSWAVADCAATYILQRNERGSSTWTTLGSNIKETRFVDTTAKEGKVYRYRVRSRNVSAFGPFKVSVEVAVMKGSAPGPVSNVSVSAAAKKITVSWDAAEGAAGYIVQRRERDSAAWTTLNSNVKECSFTDTTGEIGAIYQYRIRSRNVSFYGPFKASTEVGFMSGSTPGDIGKVTVKAAVGGKITVTWTASEGAVGYIVQRRVKGGSWENLSTFVTELKYVDKTAKTGTTYQYRIRPRNGSIYGSFKASAEVTAK